MNANLSLTIMIVLTAQRMSAVLQWKLSKKKIHNFNSHFLFPPKCPDFVIGIGIHFSYVV